MKHPDRADTVKVEIEDLVSALVDAGVFDMAAVVRAEHREDLMPAPTEDVH